ncbi:hypothetical protein ES708_02906 [subsurface metagenome]
MGIAQGQAPGIVPGAFLLTELEPDREWYEQGVKWKLSGEVLAAAESGS